MDACYCGLAEVRKHRNDIPLRKSPSINGNNLQAAFL